MESDGEAYIHEDLNIEIEPDHENYGTRLQAVNHRYLKNKPYNQKGKILSRQMKQQQRLGDFKPITIFCEYLEVLIHSFIFSRSLYPADAFEMRRQYNVAVYMCLHTEVRDYITGIVGKAHDLITEGANLDRIELCVINNDEIIEKLIFENIPCMSNNIINNAEDIEEENINDILKQLMDLENDFRSSLLNLYMQVPQLNINADELTWKVYLQIDESDFRFSLDSQKLNDLVWIKSSDDNINDQNKSKIFQIVPIKTINQNLIQLHLYLEEEAEKMCIKSSEMKSPDILPKVNSPEFLSPEIFPQIGSPELISPELLSPESGSPLLF